jgi:hypothetical protein
MPTLTINGTNATDFPSAFAAGANEPTAGTYYAVAPYGSPPRETAPEFKEIGPIGFPGVSGFSTKTLYPFGIRHISVDLIICGTKSAVETSRASLQDSFAQQARYTIVLPSGPTRNGCKMVPGTGEPVSQWAIGSKVCLLISFKFRQLSAAN